MDNSTQINSYKYIRMLLLLNEKRDNKRRSDYIEDPKERLDDTETYSGKEGYKDD